MVANNLDDLVHLTEEYCVKYRVQLVPAKTNLMVYANKSHKQLVDHAKLVNPIQIDGKTIDFVEELEHVGVIRNTAGNMPAFLKRIEAYRRSLHSVLNSGLAHGHRANPLAGLRIHSLYCAPVLLSGLASLVLSASEIHVLDYYFEKLLREFKSCMISHHVLLHFY